MKAFAGDLNPQEGEVKIEKGLNVVEEEHDEDLHVESGAPTTPKAIEFEMSHLPPEFTPKTVKIFMLVQFFVNLLINVDMGILPAGAVNIKKEKDLDNMWFGFLGSVVYLGQVIGSALASGLMNKHNPKIVLSLCLFINMISLIVFCFVDVYVVLVICRVCTGLFQIPFAIYTPVWADAVGNDVQKAKWLTYQLIASPLGVILGYGIAAGLQDNIGWRWAFYLQTMSLVPPLVGLIVIPSKYYDINLANNHRKLKEKQ